MANARARLGVVREFALALGLLLVLSLPIVTAGALTAHGAGALRHPMVSGRVTNRSGGGIGGVLVLAYDGPRSCGGSLVATAETSASGAYELRGLPADKLEFWIAPSDASGLIAPTSDRSMTENRVDFEYEPVTTGAVGVTALCSEGPLAGATVSLDGGRPSVTSSDGSCRFSGLCPGVHRLVAAAPGRRFGPVTFWVAAGDLAVVRMVPDVN